MYEIHLFLPSHPKVEGTEIREVKRFAQGPMTGRWQDKDSKNLDLLVPSSSHYATLPGNMPYPHTQIINSRKV